MGRFDELLGAAKKLQETEAGGQVGKILDKAEQRAGASLFRTTPEAVNSMNPIPEITQGIKGLWNLTEEPRQKAIESVAQKMDLAYQAGLPADERFQGIARTAMDLALPDATAFVGNLGKAPGILQKAVKGAEEISALKKGASSVAEKLASKPATEFGSVIVQPSYLERKAMAKEARKAEGEIIEQGAKPIRPKDITEYYEKNYKDELMKKKDYLSPEEFDSMKQARLEMAKRELLEQNKRFKALKEKLGSGDK